jgi:hypothetical protein
VTGLMMMMMMMMMMILGHPRNDYVTFFYINAYENLPMYKELFV